MTWCLRCLEDFRDDDTGGYNPACRCGELCRFCCDERCVSAEDSLDATATATDADLPTAAPPAEVSAFVDSQLIAVRQMRVHGPQSSVQQLAALYDRLKEMSRHFAFLRQEPHISTADLRELVDLACFRRGGAPGIAALGIERDALRAAFRRGMYAHGGENWTDAEIVEAARRAYP
jgi:hypothetical protein